MVRKWVLSYLLHCQGQPRIVAFAPVALSKVKQGVKVSLRALVSLGALIQS